MWLENVTFVGGLLAPVGCLFALGQNLIPLRLMYSGYVNCVQMCCVAGQLFGCSEYQQLDCFCKPYDFKTYQPYDIGQIRASRLTLLHLLRQRLAGNALEGRGSSKTSGPWGVAVFFEDSSRFNHENLRGGISAPPEKIQEIAGPYFTGIIKGWW